MQVPTSGIVARTDPASVSRPTTCPAAHPGIVEGCSCTNGSAHASTCSRPDASAAATTCPGRPTSAVARFEAGSDYCPARLASRTAASRGPSASSGSRTARRRGASGSSTIPVQPEPLFRQTAAVASPALADCVPPRQLQHPLQLAWQPDEPPSEDQADKPPGYR